ncbi:MAG: TetR/AcrR family transcriptional regulator [Sulfurisoma sp.]|nr:TetR/AcrR family transcriptional regulator [Sulfurisoma sp.]
MVKPTRAASLDRPAWIRGAFAILADDGFDGLRVEVLARRLKVTKGSFYWHFKDRRDLFEAVLAEWKNGRIEDIRKQTAARPGNELAALRHTIDVYAAAKNRKGIAIEAAFRLWARQDAATAAVVEEVDAERLACTRRLFLELGLDEAEAAARSVLLYAYVFGFSMMQCDRFAMDTASVKVWISRQIATG